MTQQHHSHGASAGDCNQRSSPLGRRRFLTRAAAASAAPFLATRRQTSFALAADPPPVAQLAITLDLEMSRNFPTWEQTHWDYEKGNLDEPTKQYALEAARRVHAAGGRIHFFVVGRVLEQENVDWLKQLAADGHPLGNHTYDHVNVFATRPEDIQFRFQRAPWLIAGREPAEVIAENIRLTTTALRQRTGCEIRGFRTPGGSADGLVDRPDLQQMLLAQGFRWVSSRYPRHTLTTTAAPPTDAELSAIVDAQAVAQPYRYETGLIEIPMSPVSDIVAFRSGRWPLDAFLEATRRAASHCIERGWAFDFLGHPSCLLVTDPEFRTIDLLCRLVQESGGQAQFADLDALADLPSTAATA